MATLAEQLTALTNNLKQAKIAYAMVVRNKESSTIVSRSKARLDAAQKAYDLSAPQRSDIAAAKVKADPDVVAATKLRDAAAAEVAATTKSIADAKTNLATIKETNAGNTLAKQEAVAATAAAKKAQDAKDAASEALLADQKRKQQRPLQHLLLLKKH